MPEFLQNTATNLIASFVFAMIIAAWARYKDAVSWSTAIVYGLVAVTCLFFILDRFWRPSGKVKIRKWLESTGFSIQTRTDPGFAFFYVLTDEQGVRANVYQIERNKFVVLEVKMIVDEDLAARYAKLSSDQKENLRQRIGSDLLRSGIGFADLTEFKAVRIIDQIIVTDQTSEFDFITRLFAVRNAGKLFSLTVTNETRPTPSSLTPSKGASPH